MPSYPCENRGERLGESKNRSMRPAQEFSQILPRFSLGYEGTENMFYFFYNLLIAVHNREKDDMQSVYLCFNVFHENVNSHN